MELYKQNSNKVFKVQESLLSILSSVGAKSDVLTLEEAYMYLKDYICTNFLYNVQKVAEVSCENDALGDVFGVTKFTRDDSMSLLLKCMQPLSGTGNTEKRKSESLADPVSKRIRKISSDLSDAESLFPNCKFPSPDYDSSPETVYSIQGYETAIAKNETDSFSSDECNDSHKDSDKFFEEFEVQSLSSSDDDADDSENNTDEDEVVVKAEVFICRSDSDVEFWADSSDNNEFSDSDPELGDGDKWTCEVCGVVNIKPPKGPCQMCRVVRDVPHTDERRRQRLDRRLRRRVSDRKIGSKNKNLVKSEGRKNGEGEGVDEHEEGSDRSEEDESSSSSLDTDLDNVNIPAENQSQESSYSTPGTSQESQPSVSGELASCSQSSNPETNGEVCNICLKNPQDAVFVHTVIGHRFSCYRCALKLKRKKMPCPLCRRTIKRVIRTIECKYSQ